MGCGMVRKVDELGRVVIPKEMRRVLNIKTGSSVEMFIGENNEVVLKKFSELSNVLMFAENLAETIYDNNNTACLVTDDEKVLVCKGVPKKEFLDKKINLDILEKDNDFFVLDKNTSFLNNQENLFNNNYIFPIFCDGFKCGFIVLLTDNVLSDEELRNVILLKTFLSNLLRF